MSGSGSIFDALGNMGTNPGIMALLGASGGFANAAMPTPYRGGVPFGAAIGMAANGLGAGAGNAYKNQLEQAQAQGAQLANVGTASALPVTVGRNKMLADVYSNPGLMQQLLGGSPAAPSAGAATASPSAAAPSVSPDLASLIQKSAAANGLPAPLLTALLQQESSMGKTSSNLGRVLPTTAAAPGYGVAPALPGSLDNPANNIEFAAKYLAARGAAAGVKDWTDPTQAAAGLSAYNGGGDPQYAQHVMRYAPALYGQPAASGGAQPTAGGTTAASAPGESSAMQQYQDYEARAKQATIRQFFGLPTGEDPAVLHATAQQFLKLALAGPTAGAAKAAEAGVDLATAGKIQAAKSANSNLDARPGGLLRSVDADGNVTWIKNPAVVETQDAQGNTVPMHVVPPMPGDSPGTPGTASPILGPDNKPIVTKIPAQQQEGRDEAVKDFLTKDQDSYQAAQNTQGWLNQIDHAADAMNKAGPAYMTGPFAAERLAAMSTVNDMARTLGVKPPFDQSAVASWEEMKKATTTAGFELSSHYEGHARQAAATIMNATSAVPAASNSPTGLKLVSSGIREGAQSAMDAHEYKQQVYNATQGAGLENAETDFYKAHPAQQYANRAISNVSPFAIKGPEDFAKFLPGTFVTDGKTMDPATGRLKIVQVPERVDTIGGMQFPLKMPAYVQQGAPSAS